MRTYWRLLTKLSKDTTPVKVRDYVAFESGNYESDLKEAKEKHLRGYSFVSLSKPLYDTFGEKIRS